MVCDLIENLSVMRDWYPTFAPLWLLNKSTSVFSCFCPLIDHEFRHNIVKVAVDP